MNLEYLDFNYCHTTMMDDFLRGVNPNLSMDVSIDCILMASFWFDFSVSDINMMVSNTRSPIKMMQNRIGTISDAIISITNIANMYGDIYSSWHCIKVLRLLWHIVINMIQNVCYSMYHALSHAFSNHTNQNMQVHLF